MPRAVFCATAVVVCASALSFCEREQPASSRPSSVLLDGFQAAIADAPSPDARYAAAHAFVKTVSNGEQIALGEALVASGLPDQEVVGAELLVERGRERSAAPAFARLVTRGGDMTAYFWKWLHGDDPNVAVRVYIAIARALIADIDTLTDEPRRRAEAYLVDGGIGRPIDAYSRPAVEERLKALERDIR